MKQFPALLFLLSVCSAFGQKKALEIADVHRWRKIEQTRVSTDGQRVAYVLSPVTEGDNVLCLWDAQTRQTIRIDRGTEAKFSEDGQYLVFKIKPLLDTLKAQRRRKVKDEDLPKDSLGILDLASGTLTKLPKVRSYALPEKWSGFVAYQLEPEKPAKPKKDSSAVQAAAEPDSVKIKTAPAEKTADKTEPKKEDTKENGSRMVLRELRSGREDTVPFVREYRFAKRGPALLLSSTGRDSGFVAGVYRFDCTLNQMKALTRSEKGKYTQLELDEWGRQAAFLADTDTSKARVRPWQLYYWAEKQDSARGIAGPASPFLSPGKHQEEPWSIGEFTRPEFSDDGSMLYFGIAPRLPLPDTTLLPEEIVNVEVWSWTGKRLYTELEKRLEADKKRSYPVVYHIRENRFVPLGAPELPEWRFQPERNAQLALAFTEEPYAQFVQWEGTAHKDVYAVNIGTGVRSLVLKDLRCNPGLSAAGKYILWWSEPDSAWYAWSAKTASTVRLTENQPAPFYNEEDDRPDYPNEYGLAGWLANDEAVLVYDRYDVWKIDPNGKKRPERLTRGRENNTRFRYIRLDPDQHFIPPDAPVLLHRFDDKTKAEGYSWLDLKTGACTTWLDGEFAYSRNPVKAEKAERIVFSKQNYQTFPDLWYATLPRNDPSKQPAPAPVRISEANPQQGEYNWGSIELVRWTSLSGETLEGLLVKPEGFDPDKKYPMIVNFYEKLSDNLYAHRAPDVHRSTITYTMYASRGYLVFAPDIPYRTGYPGECAYDAIVSGVTALIGRGFVDARHIGLQGHSWGGYQAAYLITRTNMFACAEAGAPVANMTSAYGGIRWESGQSRQFQYERQQSRIGGSLWEYPLRYIENSPLFSLDKVQTPALILHNDQDGAVPWQQGVELFTGLRRLGKPAWLLNYNDEPHWPLKLQNRIDFQTRMQQFFDHYLLDMPRPRWMEHGVPPLEKGILQGLEPSNSESRQ